MAIFFIFIYLLHTRVNFDRCDQPYRCIA